MYKYIIICSSIYLCAVLCDLNKEEGAKCEWEGLTGTCVKKTRCLTTLDDESPKHPICSEKDGESVICCTDCELVDDTGNVVISPDSRIYQKDGRKARDHCLQYLKDLPYRCKKNGFFGKISRELNSDNKCYTHSHPGGPSEEIEPIGKYPHQVLIGFGTDLQTAKWNAGGFVISDNYIVTAAHAMISSGDDGPPKFLATGVKKRSDPPTSWQIYGIKAVTNHPEYKSPLKYHDIALIETDSPIKFDEDVLPACLHMEGDADDEDTISTTFWDLSKDAKYKLAETIQTIKLEKYSEEECKTVYGKSRFLKNGYDNKTQMCYGSRTNKTDPYAACKGMSGESLMASKQFLQCIHTAIGITSFGFDRCGPDRRKPDVYTRIGHYIPWIESVVWP